MELNLGTASMSDDAVLQAFEECQLAPPNFTMTTTSAWPGSASNATAHEKRKQNYWTDSAGSRCAPASRKISCTQPRLRGRGLSLLLRGPAHPQSIFQNGLNRTRNCLIATCSRNTTLPVSWKHQRRAPAGLNRISRLLASKSVQFSIVARGRSMLRLRNRWRWWYLVKLFRFG